ncbi:regucalcin KNAG_0J00900 [Huiozyma naganishii CBS 8797]|uniref:SMP-30/Gluconolactonase/LRE-like region domain-containing protein n=1 Tax=Huiozyma naganishii (strain ATCC MYA-139 / BCRC 22969 / CBS 8797 / KCTC 17520 / NBRC 10181 / NCYC 3082 / Yp74L-3) TaxID=1071383 RepID=J7S2P9_HUIN7|nr:hypothetical protein KNAG_0J00900 [Kazachstania naganishii CBS 8797]CCK72172.1 hypothetical protein KNAG_0J00900 [Kazachstania naganishii CBS 8797]
MEIDCRDAVPLYHHPDARLTEGVTYIAETDTLYWVDIFKAEVHRVRDLQGDPAHTFAEKHTVFTASRGTYSKDANAVPYPDSEMGESIGVVFPDHKDSNVVYFAAKFGIGRVDLSRDHWEYLVLYEWCPELTLDRVRKLRSNDGNVSPCGKYIFVGIMRDFPYPVDDSGCILRVSLETRTLEIVWDHIRIANSLHWNSQEDRMYITDSLAFCLWECPYDTATATLDRTAATKQIDIRANTPERFVSPEPDGSQLDPQTGLLYVCVWSTGSVQVYDTRNGKFLARILLPENTMRASCCCLVGDKLYVTTANEDIDNPTAATADPHGGCLYLLDLPALPNSETASAALQSSKGPLKAT